MAAFAAISTGVLDRLTPKHQHLVTWIFGGLAFPVGQGAAPPTSSCPRKQASTNTQVSRSNRIAQGRR